MPICTLISAPGTRRHPMYYQVEIASNLFGEWSIIRRWGRHGRPGLGQERIDLFNDLRSASHTADKLRERMLRKSYVRVT